MKHILELSWWKVVLLGVASALLLLLAHPMKEWGIFHDWFPLAFVALVPLFLVLLSQGWGKSLLAMASFGVVFFGFFLQWVTRFHPLALPGLTLAVLVFYLLAVVAYRLVSRKWPEIGWLLLVLTFTGLEYLRSVGYIRFPYGSLAYTQYQFLPFIQIADLGGYLLVSAVLYLFNALIADFLFHFVVAKNRALFIARRRDLFLNRFTALAALLVLILGYGVYRLEFDHPESKGRARVGLVQNWFDFNKMWTQETKAIVYDQLTQLSRKASLSSPDLIVWPESAMLTYYEYYAKAGYVDATVYRDFFRDFNRSGGATWFLSGTLDAERVAQPPQETPPAGASNAGGKSAKSQKTGHFSEPVKVLYYNSVVFIDAGGKVVDRYYKHLLVAFAEWFPYGKWFPALKKLLVAAQASDFSPGRILTIFQHPKFSFAALICYEDVFADFCRRFVENGADALIVITNDAWSYTQSSQTVHYMFSVFRAVENRRPVLRSANAGVTAIIDSCGRSVAELPQFIEEVLVGDVEFRGGKSPWVRFGSDWIFGVFGLLVLFFASSFFRAPLETLGRNVSARLPWNRTP